MPTYTYCKKLQNFPSLNIMRTLDFFSFTHGNAPNKYSHIIHSVK